MLSTLLQLSFVLTYPVDSPSSIEAPLQVPCANRSAAVKAVLPPNAAPGPGFELSWARGRNDRGKSEQKPEEEAGPVFDRAAFDAAMDAAQGDLVDKLDKLAGWCSQKKLLLEKARIYELVLRFDPDHKKARKVLGFKRRKGEWIQSSTYREPRNYNSTALELLPAKRTETVSFYIDEVLALMERTEALPNLLRREKLNLLLELGPEDERVRKALGQSKVGDRWVLSETSNALATRAEVQTLARECLQSADLGRVDDPIAVEETLLLPWKYILQTNYVRVAGTTSEEEVTNVMRVTEAAGDLFRKLFDSRTYHLPGFHIYVMEPGHQKDKFLALHPLIRDEDRAFIESLEAAGIPRTAQVAVWANTPRERLDRVTRQSIGYFLSEEFGIGLEHGWAWEGFGMYLTYQLTGTRLTFYMEPGRYEAQGQDAENQRELMKRLYYPNSDWLLEARNYFTSNRRPSLGFSLGRKVNDLTSEDLLISYALARYLLEGWPVETPQMLRKIGAGGRPQAIVPEVFGMPFRELERRFWQWLEETV